MRIVIIGNGKAGGNLAATLAGEGNDVTVIDINPKALAKTQNTVDVLCIEGNGVDADVQKEANVGKAGMVIATTPNDEVNLLCCLIAKRLGAAKTTARVRNPEYYKHIDLIRDDLGLSMVINPERTTADEILRVLTTPTAAKVEVFEKGKMELVEFKVPENAPFVGLDLVAIYKRLKV